MTDKPMRWAVEAGHAAYKIQYSEHTRLVQTRALAIQQAAEPLLAVVRLLHEHYPTIDNHLSDFAFELDGPLLNALKAMKEADDE